MDRTRCRLFVGFPDGQLTDIGQAAILFPSATSIQLPRAVECQFESAAEAAAVVARLRQTEVADGRLVSAETLLAQRPAGALDRRALLKNMTRLHVRGIQRTATVPELQQLFTGCDDVSIPANNQRGNNGYAFVQFPDRQSAAAMASQQLTLHDKQLTVSYAVERNLALASDPRYEMVEVEDDSGGHRAKQSLASPPTGGNSKKTKHKNKCVGLV
ncbi:uncharacterized protein LOC119094032 [Pollicipes pollicipes]|uniref:uncharacterized protein LOC119094032 n=1 Tax=Pollicipes pollicipes TaxID=41117 RepID=UPI0018849B15|nr:uncharacterized protein LOC119094032 [Pollicipes pollicipes]